MAQPGQSTNGKIFTSHPQRYPKATAQAAQLVNAFSDMVKKGPRTMVATIVDTSFHTTQGYVLVTTELGIVPVYGVPIGTVVPQMRLLVRQQGGKSTVRTFVFDGYAPVLSSQNQTGSILYANPAERSGVVLATTTASLATPTGLSGPSGYYWHAFFFLPQLPPAGSFYTLLSLWTGSVATSLSLEMLPSGLLRFRSTDGHGYITTVPVAPHSIHWVQIEPGLGAGQEFQIDGTTNYTGLLSSSDVPTFAGNTASYTLLALTDGSGNNPCPLGTWISRIGFGMSFNGVNVVALPNGKTVPTGDSTIPSFNVSVTQVTEALYLCTDTVGSASCANSAPGSSASALTLTSAYTRVNALGPY